MADVIRIKYDGMNQISGEFETLSATVKQISQQVTDSMQVLKQGGWLAPSANDFYHTMDDDVLQGIQRLINALNTASHTISTLNATFKSGEQSAGALLKF